MALERVQGLINGGLINAGHALVNAGIIRAAAAGAGGLPSDAGTPAYSWWADVGLYSDDAHTTPQTTNGGVIANWQDRIAGVYLAQTGSSNRPNLVSSAQNGKPGVSFDGSNDYLSQSFTLSTPFTEFYVISVDKQFSGTNRIATSISNQKCNLVVPVSGDVEMDSLGGGPDTTEVPDNSFCIICCVHNGTGTGDTGTRIRVNAGTADTSPNIAPSTGSLGGRVLGAYNDGSNAQKMVLCAYVIYASALGSSAEGDERSVLNTYYAAF